MLQMRSLILLGILTMLPACGGGGGSSSSVPVAPWPQFRHDTSRSGGANGSLLSNRGNVRFAVIDDGDSPEPVSSSPVIDADGTIYVGSEGGTLRALRRGDLSTKWSTRSCSRCCAADAGSTCDTSLGPIVSTPALQRRGTTTVIALGDRNGRVYRFSVDESLPEPQPVCEMCFEPDLDDDAGPQARIRFASSPLITNNAATGSIAAIVIGAEIFNDGEADPSAGKLYGINSDGSLRWQFPRRGEGVIGPVSSSPAIGVGGGLVFTAGDDSLYILTRDGVLRRQVSIASLTTPNSILQPSVVSSTSLFVGTAGGEIYAFNQDGTFRWVRRFADERFLGSIAIGAQLEPSPTAAPETTGTPTPTATLAPDEPTPTPTITPTPGTFFSTVIGISEAGRVVFVEATTGNTLAPTDSAVLDTDAAPVHASVALSIDGYIAVADTGGRVHVVSSGDGLTPRFCRESPALRCFEDADCGVDDTCAESYWPVQLPSRCRGGTTAHEICTGDDECPSGVCVAPAVYSSPAIDNDGTIYVGSDDGFFYAIGGSGTPAVAPTPTPAAAAGTSDRL